MDCQDDDDRLRSVNTYCLRAELSAEGAKRGVDTPLKFSLLSIYLGPAEGRPGPSVYDGVTVVVTGDPLQSLIDIMIVFQAPKHVGMPPEIFSKVNCVEKPPDVI